jgi:hypothetical protein
MPGLLVSLRHPLKSVQTLASCTRDSCSATATTSHQRYRLATTSAPRATHAAAASCVFSSRYRSEREACSILFPQQPPSTHPLCLSPSAFAPSVERWPPHTALVHLRAPLSHAKPVAEPLFFARNCWSTEPAASFSCQGRLPVEHHLWPPKCSSVTAATST